MHRWPARLLLSAVCLVLGFMVVTQFRSQRVDHGLAAQSPADQALYISQLYRSNQDQQASLEQIQAEIARYEQAETGGSSNLVSMLNEIQQLRMVNGEVDVAGPGVQVSVNGAQNVVQMLQDLTNEL